MLVLLPPSETKAAGGDGPPLSLASLSAPELTATRRVLLDRLAGLSADEDAARAALGLSAGQVDELRRNRALRTAPTLGVLRCYTGVLYDALDLNSLRAPARARARSRLAVVSALFGLLTAADVIPPYRLSAGSSLPGLGTVRSVWRPVLPPVLARCCAQRGLVVDLRSGPYAALAPLPGAVRVRVVSSAERGVRRVVGHHNKAHKGRLARLLAATASEPRDADDLCRVARRGGLRLERTGEREVDLLLPG